MALFSSIKLFNSLAFFNLKIYNELVFKRMIGAKTLYFCVEQTTLTASCLPLANNPCNNLLYLTNLGSSA